MPFVQAKCPNCGGILAVDNSNDAAVCQFCDTPFIVEKAINNYNITNNVNVGAGAVVNIVNDTNNDFVIEAGVLKQYKGASDKVVIPNTVKEIGKEAFQGLPITEVRIPDSVTSIGYNAFRFCESLTSVTIGNNVEIIGAEAFGFCKFLIDITIPDGVTLISHEAFYNCISLTSVTIGNGAKIIGVEAFNNCTSLMNITIPDSVTDIGENAFSNTAYYNNDSNWKNDVLYIGNHLIQARESLNGSYKIKSDTKTIGDFAFFDCRLLTNIAIPDSVTKIARYAFCDCIELKSVAIPNSVTMIGDHAFCDCQELKSVVIPNSITMIGDYAFKGCPCESTIREKNANIYQKSGGCYVATAVYGSYDCPQVWTLRRYRDNQLALTWYGRLFIYLYYAISPTLVKWFGETNWFKNMWRGTLDKMVKNLKAKGYEDTPYQDKNWK